MKYILLCSLSKKVTKLLTWSHLFAALHFFVPTSFISYFIAVIIVILGRQKCSTILFLFFQTKCEPWPWWESYFYFHCMSKMVEGSINSHWCIIKLSTLLWCDCNRARHVQSDRTQRQIAKTNGKKTFQAVFHTRSHLFCLFHCCVDFNIASIYKLIQRR